MDKATTIYAMDDIKDHSIESMSFAANSQASYILKTLIEKTGIPVAVFSPRRDYTYKDSQTVDGDLMENIKNTQKSAAYLFMSARGKSMLGTSRRGTT